MSSRSNQRIKDIPNDFMICADAMLACFDSIQENKAGCLMPEFLPELGKSIGMMNRELNIHLIEAECEKSQ